MSTDTLYLIEQFQKSFAEIQKESSSDLGDYDTTFILPDAQYCLILEDAEKSSYQCTSAYSLGDEQAKNRFQQLVEEMRGCIGNIADEQVDQPVSHRFI